MHGIINRISLSIRRLPILAALIGMMVALTTAWQLLNPSAISADTSIFMAMGQGILNGLTPYVDLFETKSPAIFLLSALSLHLFGNAMLGNILGAIIITCIPVLIGILAWLQTKDATIAIWNALLALLLLLSSLLVTRPWQIEFFSAGFGLLAMAIIAVQSTNILILAVKTFTTALCFFIAFYLKEPFIFSCIAGGLILTPHRKSLVLDVLLPVGLACMAWLIIMAATGYLDVYIHQFLPLLGETRRSAMSQPLWARGLNIGRSMMLVITEMPIVVLFLGFLSFLVLQGRQSTIPYHSLWLLCSAVIGLSSLGLSMSSYDQPIHQYNLLPTIILLIIGACQTKCTMIQKKWYLTASMSSMDRHLLFPAFLWRSCPEYRFSDTSGFYHAYLHRTKSVCFSLLFSRRKN